MRAGGDDEAIHDARVALRRLEAAAGTFRDIMSRDERRELLGALREWRRRFGRARDHEVLAAGLTEPDHLALGGEALRALAESQTAKRDEARLQAAKWAKPERQRRLEEALRPLLELSVAVRREELVACGELRCSRRKERARAALERASRTEDDERLHDARIALKRWRYAVEALESVGHKPVRGVRKRLRLLQRELGTVHDRAVLRDLLTSVAGRLRKPKRGDRVANADSLSAIAARVEAQRLEAIRRFRARLAAPAWRDASRAAETDPRPSPRAPRARRGRSRP